MARKIFYHMSRTKLPINTPLKSRGSTHVDPHVEKMLTARKPDPSIARSEGVYLGETEDASRHGLTYDYGYLHTVEPVGDLQRRDSNWVGQLQLRHHRNPKMVQMQDKRLIGISDEQIADRYWAGEASPNPNWANRGGSR